MQNQNIRQTFVFIFAALITLSGCQNKNSGLSSPTTQFTERSYSFQANKSSWLRNHLPAQTVAYASIPNVWNLLFDPKADSLHPIQEHPAFIKQVDGIKNAAAKQYLDKIPQKQQALVNTLLLHHSGPIELAMLNYSPAALMPNVAIATSFDGLTAEQLDQLINQSLQQVAPQMQSEATTTGDVTQWELNVQSITSLIQFNQKSGQLLVLGGLGANQKKLDAIIQNQTDPALDKIMDLDRQSDPSGLNLKAWVAVSKLYKLGAAFLQPQQRQAAEFLAVDQMDYVWLGTSSAQGKSALSMHVLMPEAGWRLFMPRLSLPSNSPSNGGSFDVTLAGKPESVLKVALPTVDQIATAVSAIPEINTANNNLLNSWPDFKQKFKDIMGFDVADLLQAYHQEMVMVNDESGRWFALKVKDQGMHQNIVDQFSKLVKTSPSTQSLAGVEINQMHYASMQQLFLLTDAADRPKDFDQISEFMGLFKQHSFWVREGDVIYFAAVPQVLAEKFNSKRGQQLSDWLQNNQRTNWDSAILAFGKEIDHLPQDIYHIYLIVIQMLGDIAGTQVDLFQLPTASELHLPNTGRMNMALSADSEKVSLTLAYEYSMLESLVSGEGSMMSIYTLAILMSYALPAYRDYTVRAKVAKAMAATATLKLSVAEHFVSEGSLANLDTESLAMFEGIKVEAESGTISIQMNHWDDQMSHSDYVYLIPEFHESGHIEWHCESNIKASYLPSMCRY